MFGLCPPIVLDTHDADTRLKTSIKDSDSILPLLQKETSMMTKVIIAQVFAYFDENDVSQKQQLEELGIPAWKIYDAKRKYALKQERDN